MTQYENYPNNPHNGGEFGQNNHNKDDIQFYGQLKSIQNLVTIATIAGPASLLIGGVLLGSIAVICGILAATKLNKLPIANQAHAELVGKVKRSAYISIFISAAAVIINGIFVAMMMPEVLSMLETGDLSALQGNASSPTNSGTSSVWG